jgi:hypothetical protein
MAALGVLGPLLGVPERIVYLLVTPLLVAVLVACVIPSRIVVGPDGIEHRWLFWRRFFPLRDVRALKRTFAIPARLVLRDGGEAFLPYTFSPRDDIMGRRSKALVAIDRALDWAAARPALEAPDTAVLLARNRDGLAAWRARVAGSDYRSPGVSNETLWRIVDDPSERADLRGAAAVLLAPTTDGEARTRIGEVAATTANTKLRVLLDATAKGATDEEVESKLAEVETQMGARRRVSAPEAR